MKGIEMLALTTYAQDINRLHQLATEEAGKAIANAQRVGEMLIEVKRSMKHGQFLLWVHENTVISARQSQRYMAVATGKKFSMKQLAGKSDTMSHLPPPPKASTGLIVDGVWIPEPNCTYLFNEADAAYWVTHNHAGYIHVCKHYSGQRISSVGFYWRYTIFAEVTDPDLTSQFYMGTRFPIWNRKGIAGVLQSYGLTDIEGSLVFGYHDPLPEARPFGEPEPENWYWDSSEPDDALYKHFKANKWVNERGAITFDGMR